MSDFAPEELARLVKEEHDAAAAISEPAETLMTAMAAYRRAYDRFTDAQDALTVYLALVPRWEVMPPEGFVR